MPSKNSSSNSRRKAASKATASKSPAKANSTKKASGKLSVATSRSRTETRLSPDQIARRAYEIWIEKGRPGGLDIENWFQAESELRKSA